MLKANFHTHTTFCDGKSTAEEMVQQALKIGFTQLGFSGHMDSDIHMDMNAYLQEIRRLKHLYQDQIEIFIGVELDALYEPHCADEAEYRIGSTHFIDIPGANRRIGVDVSPANSTFICQEYFGGDWYKMCKAYYETEATVCDRIPCDFIGHYDLISRFNDQMHTFDESDPRYLSPAFEVMDHLASYGKPFEINTGGVARGGKKDFYPSEPMLRHLHDIGGEIIISSDAHYAEHLNYGFTDAVRKALACGFTHTNVLSHLHDGRVAFRLVALHDIA